MGSCKEKCADSDHFMVNFVFLYRKFEKNDTLSVSHVLERKEFR